MKNNIYYYALIAFGSMWIPLFFYIKAIFIMYEEGQLSTMFHWSQIVSTCLQYVLIGVLYARICELHDIIDEE